MRPSGGPSCLRGAESLWHPGHRDPGVRCRSTDAWRAKKTVLPKGCRSPTTPRRRAWLRRLNVGASHAIVLGVAGEPVATPGHVLRNKPGAQLQALGAAVLSVMGPSKTPNPPSGRVLWGWTGNLECGFTRTPARMVGWHGRPCTSAGTHAKPAQAGFARGRSHRERTTLLTIG